MAIDTAEKRKSISGIQYSLLVGMTNNATHDQEWRQESGWSYSGILAGGAPIPPPPPPAATLGGGGYFKPGRVWKRRWRKRLEEENAENRFPGSRRVQPNYAGILVIVEKVKKPFGP